MHYREGEFNDEFPFLPAAGSGRVESTWARTSGSGPRRLMILSAADAGYRAAAAAALVPSAAPQRKQPWKALADSTAAQPGALGSKRPSRQHKWRPGVHQIDLGSRSWAAQPG